MEVLDADAEPGDLRGFLLDIADYVLENGVALQDGETIGFGEGQRLAITRSAGVWHQGMTLKIQYAPHAGGLRRRRGEDLPPGKPVRTPACLRPFPHRHSGKG